MFTVYTTNPSIDAPFLVKTLNLGIFGNFTEGNSWALSQDFFLNAPVSKILQHHRTNPGDNFDKNYFVIADRADWQSEGVLAVTLNFDGFIDAARMRANVAGSAIPSASIANTTWSEAVSDVSARELYPTGKFAVYATDAVADVSKRGGLLESLNFGLESRKEFAPAVCRMAGPRRCDVEGIAREHATLAAEGGFDLEVFVVVDDAEWEDVGVEIARVGDGDGGEVDSVAKPVDVAAEVLTWVHQGLLSWKEGKVWDEDKLEGEE